MRDHATLCRDAKSLKRDLKSRCRELNRLRDCIIACSRDPKRWSHDFKAWSPVLMR